MRVLFTLLALAVCATAVRAADLLTEHIGALVQDYIGNANLDTGSLRGNVQMLKGHRDGVALCRYSDGAVYFGDITDGKPDGQGVMIYPYGAKAPLGEEYRICAGRWRSGRPAGRVRCYDGMGRLLFKGRIDPATGALESDLSDEDADMMFGCIDADGGATFAGEYNGAGMNGLGLLLLPDRIFFISKFKDGERRGSGTYIYPDHNWLTESYKNGETTYVSSSVEYSQLVDNVRGVTSQWTFDWKDFTSGLVTKLNDFGQALSQSRGSDGEQADTDAPSGPSRTSSGGKGGRKGGNLTPSEQRNLNSDRNVYANYDGQLAAIFAGNRDASCSHIRDIQSKMRGLRKKWEARGQNFPHFANEDAKCGN